jgi:type II secretion system protein N
LKKKANRLIGIPRPALFLGGCFLLLCVAVLIVRPYSKLERKTERLLSQVVPGTKVGGVDIDFPLSITLTNLEVPVTLNHQKRPIRIGQASGNLALFPLLKGVVEAELNSDFFGGILWVKADAKALPGQAGATGPLVTFDARARQVDLAEVCKFAQAPVQISGRCDIDAEGNVREQQVKSLNGKGLLIANGVEIPPLESESLLLPANRKGEGKARLTAEQGVITVQDFSFTGSAYDLSGAGKIALKEPAETSPIDFSFGIVFKEPFTITDSRLSGSSARSIVEALISSKSKVILKAKGTVGEPEAEIDPASSLLPLMKYLEQ